MFFMISKACNAPPNPASASATSGASEYSMSIEPRRRYTSAAVYGRVTPFQRLPVFHACSREVTYCCLSMVPVRDGRPVSVQKVVRYRGQELRKVRAGSEVGED